MKTQGVALSDLVRQLLRPAGKNSFESVVARILASITGTNFRLSKAGAQGGIDLRDDGRPGSVIAVECKRYLRTTKLDRTELLGKLEDAHLGDPDLDVWALVTTAPLPAQDFQTLQRSAHDKAITLVAISASGEAPSAVDALLAHGVDSVIAELRSKLDRRSEAKLRHAATVVLSSPGFAAAIDQIKRQLLPGTRGFDDFRVESHRLARRLLASPDSSLRVLLQEVVVIGDGAKVVPRPDLFQQLDRWWSERSAFLHQDNSLAPIAALVGEEGEGKTWGVAAWLAHKIAGDDFPIVGMISANECSEVAPSDILRRAVSSPTDEENDPLRQRLVRWATSKQRTVSALLVIDGINQSFNEAHWARLIHAFQVDLPGVALAITARPTYWNSFEARTAIEAGGADRHLLSGAARVPNTTIRVQPFNDDELNAALELNGRARSDFLPGTLALLRKPRYCELACRYFEELRAVGGEVTKAWLFYLDWKSRYSRRLSAPCTDEEFAEVVMEAARRERLDKAPHSRGSLYQSIPPLVQQRLVYDELVSGGIVSKSQSGLILNEPALVLGLGLLLVQELRRIPSDARAEEVLAQWLETGRESDFQVSIIEMAVLHSLGDTSTPDTLKVKLLRSWFEALNAGRDMPAQIAAHFRLSPKTYLAACEEICADVGSAWARTGLLEALVIAWHRPQFRSEVGQAVEKWLRVVHTEPESWHRFESGEKRDQFRKSVADDLSRDIDGLVMTIAGMDMHVSKTSNDALAHLAIATLSYVDPSSHLAAVSRHLAGAIATDSIHRIDAIRWLIVSSRVAISTELDKICEVLASDPAWAVQHAAARLLQWEGSSASQAQLGRLTESAKKPRGFRERGTGDVCLSGFNWPDEACEKCLARPDVPTQRLIRELKERVNDPALRIPKQASRRLVRLALQVDVNAVHANMGWGTGDYEFEEVARVLARVDSRVMARLARRFVSTLPARTDVALRLGARYSGEWRLLLRDREHRSAYRAWRNRREATPGTDASDLRHAEANLLALGLGSLKPAEQLAALLDRPDDASDWFELANEFKEGLTSVEALRAMPAPGSSEIKLQRFLWFISRCCKDLSDELLQRIDEIVPKAVSGWAAAFFLDCLSSSRGRAAKRIFDDRHWSWKPGMTQGEPWSGSHALVAFHKNEPIDWLLSRVHPSFAGYVIQVRGYRAAELDKFATYVDRALELVFDQSSKAKTQLPPAELQIEKNRSGPHSHHYRSLDSYPSLFEWLWTSEHPPGPVDSSDYDRERRAHFQQQQAMMAETLKQMRQEVDLWLDRGFKGNALKEAVKCRPDLARRWVARLSPASGARTRFVEVSEFCLRLFEALVEGDPSLAVTLYDHLSAIEGLRVSYHDSGARVVDEILFSAPKATLEIQERWDQFLAAATSDEDYLRLAFLCHKAPAKSWLWERTVASLEGDLTWQRARGITLLGAIGTRRAFALLTRHQRTLGQGYLRELTDHAIRRGQMFSRANYWFERVKSAATAEEAQAFLILFAVSADLRCTHLLRKLERALGHLGIRGSFKTLEEELLSKMKSNMKPSMDNLHGLKKSSDMWPFHDISLPGPEERPQKKGRR